MDRFILNMVSIYGFVVFSLLVLRVCSALAFGIYKNLTNIVLQCEYCRKQKEDEQCQK